ncbi:MAG: prolyl aminopeptidase [Propionibacteriaceae bacterium]
MYPASETRTSGLLEVPGGHQIFWEESGHPDGLAVLHLHGGPGGASGATGYRRNYDPQRYRIITLDQRGCGRSRPLVTERGYDLAENTTPHLIADIEAVREHLGVDRWVLDGVSWGSTLALAYAQAHPDRVAAVILVAVTAGTRVEVDWITETVGRVFPEEWDRFATFAEQADIGYRRGDGRIVEAYAELLRNEDLALRDAAAQAWCRWEDTHVRIGAPGRHNERYDDPSFRQVFATLVTHYWSNDCFLGPDGALPEMSTLAGIPGFLIHGRLDISGPVQTAWDLQRGWPGSELIIIEGDGHGGESMGTRWTAAADRIADQLRR